jgi:hypothetical protein
VQEAAYSAIAERSRAEAHLRIRRLLAAHTSPAKRQEAIVEIDPRPGVPQASGTTALDRAIRQQNNLINNSICDGRFGLSIIETDQSFLESEDFGSS